jgi:hypothetical protein
MRAVVCTVCGEPIGPGAPHLFNRCTLDRVHPACREVIELVQRDSDDASNPWLLVAPKANGRAA